MGKYTADGAMLWVLTSIETILVITISKDHKLQRKWHIHRIWPPGLSSHYFIVYYISHLTQGRPIGETWYFCEYFLKDFLNNSRNVGPKHSLTVLHRGIPQWWEAQSYVDIDCFLWDFSIYQTFNCFSQTRQTKNFWNLFNFLVIFYKNKYKF